MALASPPANGKPRELKVRARRSWRWRELRPCAARAQRLQIRSTVVKDRARTAGRSRRSCTAIIIFISRTTFTALVTSLLPRTRRSSSVCVYNVHGRAYRSCWPIIAHRRPGGNKNSALVDVFVTSLPRTRLRETNTPARVSEYG